MKEILFRLGQVAWWAGALIAAGSVIGTVVTLISRPHEELPFLLIVVGAFVVAPLWALSFILAGSFWKPPIGKN